MYFGGEHSATTDAMLAIEQLLISLSNQYCLVSIGPITDRRMCLEFGIFSFVINKEEKGLYYLYISHNYRENRMVFSSDI